MIKKLSVFFLFFNFLIASDYSSSYNGNTGVLETPNARIMPDWHMKTFFNVDKPYTYYGFGGTPLPFLEANFHVTQLDGIKALTAGYGDYKDKSLNLKLLLSEETNLLPAIAIGADDIWGTALYTSKYFVLSKRVSYFDFTLGYAKGRLGGEDLTKYNVNTSNTGSSNNTAFNFIKNTDFLGGQPFGSVVFNATPDLSFMAEYSPIDYTKDKINPFTGGGKYELPNSKFNFGAKYNISSNSILTFSYQRGNTFSFGYTYQFGFDRTGAFEHIPDTKWKADFKKKEEYKNLTEKELSDKLSNEIAAENFRDVQTSVYKNKIWSEIDNGRYNTDLQAIGRAISTIDEVAPSKYDTIYMTLKDKNTNLKTFKVNRREFDLYENGKVSDEYMRDALVIDNTKNLFKEFSENNEVYKTEKNGFKRFNYYFGPKFKTYLNAPDKPLAMKISAQAKFDLDLGKGFYINGNIEHPLYNNIDTIPSSSLESTKLSIRSGMIDYFRYDDTQLQNLTLTHVRNLPFESLGKFEIGYFDYAYAGIDLELAKTFFDERVTLGLQYQKVNKRVVNNLFKIYNDYSYDAKFLNASFLISSKYNMFLNLKYGQFLAGDKGIKVEITRNYKNFILGAYATFTNSEEVFQSTSNKGYIDKGIYIKVPLEVFTYKNLKGMVDYGLSPWTRDVGQYAGTSIELYKTYGSENNSHIMKKYIEKLKD